MSGKGQNGDKWLIWDPFISLSYYFQQDNNPECVQLLGMTLASHLQEQGEGYDSLLPVGSSSWAQAL